MAKEHDTKAADQCVVRGCMGVAFGSDKCEYHLRASQRGEEFERWDQKATNPKDAIGTTKLPMHLIPGSAKAAMTLAFLEGALKYGKYNWRVAGVRASIYLDAMERHLEKFKNGENCDPETGVPHLGSIMACAAILIDAFTFDKLNDDRPPSGPVAEYIDDLQANVRRLQDKFADCDPHQCTIEDTQYGLET